VARGRAGRGFDLPHSGELAGNFKICDPYDASWMGTNVYTEITNYDMDGTYPYQIPGPQSDTGASIPGLQRVSDLGRWSASG
jgi:hypothetical protein